MPCILDFNAKSLVQRGLGKELVQSTHAHSGMQICLNESLSEAISYGWGLFWLFSFRIYEKCCHTWPYLVNLPASFSLWSLVAALLLYNQKTNVTTCLGFVTVTKQTHLMRSCLFGCYALMVLQQVQQVVKPFLKQFIHRHQGVLLALTP